MHIKTYILAKKYNGVYILCPVFVCHSHFPWLFKNILPLGLLYF